MTGRGTHLDVDPTLLAVIAVVAIALLFDFTNGFHDAANSVATIVATRVLRPRWAVVGSTAVGAPVSTTHTVAGAVTGVGLAAPGHAVGWGVARRMVLAWVVTLPAAGVTAAAVYGVTQLPEAPRVALLGLLGAGAAVLLVLAWQGAARPADISRELDERTARAAAAPA